MSLASLASGHDAVHASRLVDAILDMLKAGLQCTFQSRAGQGSAQGRAEPSAGQSRARQGKPGQGRAEQGRAGQGRAGQGRAGPAPQRQLEIPRLIWSHRYTQVSAGMESAVLLRSDGVTVLCGEGQRPLFIKRGL